FLAFIATASELAAAMRKIGSVLGAGNPNLCAALLGIKRLGVCAVAHITNGIFVRGGIPVECAPFRHRGVDFRSGQQCGNMLCIERMAQPSAILGPEVKVVEL